MILTYQFNPGDYFYYDADIDNFIQNIEPDDFCKFALFVYEDMTEHEKQSLGFDLIESDVVDLLRSEDPDTIAMSYASDIVKNATDEQFNSFFGDELLYFYKDEALEQYDYSEYDASGGLSESDFT